MKTAIDWFKGDGSDIVHRWAYFGAFADMATNGNANGLENKDGSVRLSSPFPFLTIRSTPWDSIIYLFSLPRYWRLWKRAQIRAGPVLLMQL